jgi:hypothetical protein
VTSQTHHARPLLVPGEGRLAPVTAAFVLFGGFWGGWAVTAADFERSLGLGNGAFGALLSLALLGGAGGNATGGAAAERWGTSRVLSAALVGWAVLLGLGALVHGTVLLAAALAAVVCAGGLVDVAMNVAASAMLAETPGYLVRFHGRFNAGASVGAVAAGALLGSRLGWRPLWVGGGILAAGFAVWCWLVPLPASERGDAAPLTGAVGVLRREGLLLLAFAFAVAAMVEGGIELWGVLFLRTRLNSGLLVGAGGAAFAYLVAATARFTLGERVGRRGPSKGVAIGAGTAAAGAAVMAASNSRVMAAAGLIAGAGGISMCWPLFVARAASGHERPGPGVGAMSAIGYLGLVAGPALVGVISEGLGLRAGLGFLALAGVAVAVIPLLGSARGASVGRADHRGVGRG